MASMLIKIDKTNSQKDFQVIAEDKNGNSHIGYIVIEKPWFEPESNHTYWLYENDNQPNNFCGGADTHLIRTEVRKETIRPFTQIEEIKYALRQNLTVDLVNNISDKDPIAKITSESDIPYQLYNT